MSSPVADTTTAEEDPSTETWDDLVANPMDPQITSIQPGGGVVIRLEQAWGKLRRGFLRMFRRGYIKRMEACRKGTVNPCPHPVLDPRDLKFFRNQNGNDAWHWEAADDRFRKRDRIPFARAGLAELIVFSLLIFGAAGTLIAMTLGLEWTGAAAIVSWVGITALLIIGILIVWFFRDPERTVPDHPCNVVSPADGKVVTIEEVEDPHIGPAVLIGVFLSIFNVHLNRAPLPGRVVALRYRKGKYLNALRAESTRENEQLAIFLESSENGRRAIVRQIAGALARRIVCWLKPGDELARGERVGMIKLGSRTELLIPREEGLEITTTVGKHIKAGRDVLATYSEAAP